jgi:hypothetical protein
MSLTEGGDKWRRGSHRRAYTVGNSGWKNTVQMKYKFVQEIYFINPEFCLLQVNCMY